jgi:diguanylate cyclase (GGDEF)-like protein
MGRRSNADESADLTNELEQEGTDRTRQDLDQSAADLEQTQADTDQATSETDQAASDSDQSLADRDQHASDRDQAVADSQRRSTGPGSPAAEKALDSSRAERDASTNEREHTTELRAGTSARRLATAEIRDEIARTRDLTAAARDRTAQARDQAAGARDRAAEARERHAAIEHDVDEAVGTLRTIRLSGATVRQQSALERAAAAADRAAAAGDRELAAADRGDAGLDELTGVFRRGTGELALGHEIDRCRREDHPLVLVMIDVDGLKAVNDRDGHAAGDALLRAVSTAFMVTLRSYDVAVRWGGDEFVCALPGIAAASSGDRVAQIQRELEILCPGATISAGIAELRRDDTLTTIVARADKALYQSRAASRMAPGHEDST